MTQQETDRRRSAVKRRILKRAGLTLLAIVAMGATAAWALHGQDQSAEPSQDEAGEDAPSLKGLAEHAPAPAATRPKAGAPRTPGSAAASAPESGTEPDAEPAEGSASETAPAAPNDKPEYKNPAEHAMEFEQDPGVLGISIRTLRKETIDSYATPSLGVVALGLEDLGLSTENRSGHVESGLGQRLLLEGNTPTVSKKSRHLMDGIGRLLAENPDTKVQILVYSETRGDAGYNKRLTQRQADTIKAYLVGRGVPAPRIAAAGLGQEQPPTPTGKRGSSQSKRSKSQRILLIVEPLTAAEQAAMQGDVFQAQGQTLGEPPAPPEEDQAPKSPQKPTAKGASKPSGEPASKSPAKGAAKSSAKAAHKSSGKSAPKPSAGAAHKSSDKADLY